jgi:hypothetical protein
MKHTSAAAVDGKNEMGVAGGSSKLDLQHRGRHEARFNSKENWPKCGSHRDGGLVAVEVVLRLMSTGFW